MPSLCPELEAIVKDCDNNIGGIQEVLVNDFDDVDSVTITSGEVTAMTLDSTTPIYFKRIEVTRDSSNYQENKVIDTTNGTTLFEQIVNLVIKKRDLAKRNAIELLTNGQRDIMMAIKDNNNQWWLCGYSENFSQGLQVTGGDDGTGTAKSDMNGYNIALSNRFPKMMYPMDEAVIASIIAP